MKVLCILLVSIVSASFCNAENILLSAASTDKKLILLNIEYSNKKYKIVDHAIFNLPFQAGLTALRRLQDGNFQVVWTAQDASKKIKMNSMIVDSDLNKVGNTKKFPRVLASHFNLNIVNRNQQSLKAADTDGSFMTYSKDVFTVVAERVGLLGAPQGGPDPLFTAPGGVDDFFDTAAVELIGGQFGFVSLAYVEQRNQYVGVFGNTGNLNPISVFGFTGGDIVSTDLLSVPGTDDYYFMFVERFNKLYSIKNRRFDGPTGQPIGPLTINISNITGDLGQLQFFNMLTVVPSEVEPKGAHAFWIDLGDSSTDIWGHHISANNGKRNSPPIDLNFDGIGLPNIQFIYALDTETIPERTACLQDDSNPATNVVVNLETGAYQFNCNGTIYTGTASVVTNGSNVTVDHNSGTSRLRLNINLNTNRGTATFQSPPGTTICTIVDRNIDDNNCN